MPYPMNPPELEVVDEGEPAPIPDDSLAEPDPADIEAAPAIEEEEPAEPDTADDALAMEIPIILGAEPVTLTALTYLRDSTPEGVLIHAMITADGTEPADLGLLELGVELSDGQVVEAVLPDVKLESGETWEADLLLDAVVADLAPGASVVRYTFSGEADRFARL